MKEITRLRFLAIYHSILTFPTKVTAFINKMNKLSNEDKKKKSNYTCNSEEEEVIWEGNLKPLYVAVLFHLKDLKKPSIHLNSFTEQWFL